MYRTRDYLSTPELALALAPAPVLTEVLSSFLPRGVDQLGYTPSLLSTLLYNVFSLITPLTLQSTLNTLTMYPLLPPPSFVYHPFSLTILLW